MKKVNMNKFVLSREIELVNPDNFTVVMETLERIGMVSNLHKTLFQSCHLLHKKNKLYIVHFKEMYILDRKYSSLSMNDIAIRNLITILLSKWGLIKLVNPIENEPVASGSSITIIPHKDRDKWKLESKYTFRSLRKE